MDNDEWQGNYEFFTANEMKCKGGPNCDCKGTGLPKHSFMVKLDLMRKALRFPFIVSSAYRCTSYNALVSKSGRDGAHTTGLAVDLKLMGHEAIEFLRAAIAFGATGIGVNQKGLKSSRFIHIDFVQPGSRLPRPDIWSYD